MITIPVAALGMMSTVTAQAGVLGTPTLPIDCDWSGNYVTCTVNEPQGVGSILIYNEIGGEPWFSLLEPPGCPTSKSFGTHSDGPSTLLIVVNPCGNSDKIGNYRYVPMEPNGRTGKVPVLRVPDENDLAKSVEGLLEENRRLWKFMEFLKRDRGVIHE
jgi:hypothetical protein